MVIESLQSSSEPSTGLVFAFFNWKPRLRQDKSETCCFEEFVLKWELCFHLCEVYRFQNLVDLELPINAPMVSLKIVSFCLNWVRIYNDFNFFKTFHKNSFKNNENLTIFDKHQDNKKCPRHFYCNVPFVSSNQFNSKEKVIPAESIKRPNV